jgi:acyl-coenzyme A synthetase/AMP-(fatty) acid ligase/acyl carrier protein
MAKMLLLEEETRAGLGRLSVMLVGGEALPPALARDLKGVLSGKLLNMYGPTETTIWSSYHAVEEVGADIPIGRPIANTDILVLDRQQNLVPPGQDGELAIGGHGLARGYLRREELTNERFVPHPVRPGEKIYRTGDLGRFDADGTLRFRGRLDHQVKLRGYRIELGEIEARLGEHPEVRECAVIVREDVPGDQRLVAYVVPKAADQKVDADALRKHLAEGLPDYMVPSVFVTLRALPQTPNKKIDRKALPRPEAGGSGPARSAASGPREAPADDLERTIAGIWCELLERPEVSVNDNFFDLGGHSLLTIQVLGRLKPHLDRPVSLVDLFRYPTIRALTTFLRSSGRDDAALDESAARGAERQRLRRAMADRRRV